MSEVPLYLPGVFGAVGRPSTMRPPPLAPKLTFQSKVDGCVLPNHHANLAKVQKVNEPD